MSRYEHTQTAPLKWLLYALAVATLSSAWQLRGDGWVAVVLLLLAVLFAILGMAFGQLTVRDEGDHLRVVFGPLPLFGTRIPYDKIRSVEPGRSTLIDGFGIHYVPGRGWTYNLWGYSCVTLKVEGRTVRVGSDDVEGLVAFLRARLPKPER